MLCQRHQGTEKRHLSAINDNLVVKSGLFRPKFACQTKSPSLPAIKDLPLVEVQRTASTHSTGLLSGRYRVTFFDDRSVTATSAIAVTACNTGT